MKSLVPAIALMAALPPAAQAQIDIRLSPQPSARGMVGPLSLSAILGPDGIDLRVDDRSVGVISTSRRTSIPGRRTSSGGTSTTRTSTSRTSTSGTTSRASAAAVIATADRYVGTRYVWGGTTPNGFDCSGFVQYVFRRHGVQLPRTSRQQAGVGQAVVTALESLRPGDLMLFASNGSRIDHVAIYVGRNRIIHSSASGGGVAYDDLTSSRGRWFANHHVASRRVLADGRSLVGDLDAALRALTALDPPDRAPRR
jgi:cell wall-associated NlpC family hydrolase